jgi:hypothetical protein
MLNASYSFITINYLKFGELTDILEISTLFIIDHKRSISIFLQFFIFSQYHLIHKLTDIVPRLEENCCNSAQKRSHYIILLAIFHYVFDHHLATLFVIDLLELFGNLVSVVNVLAIIKQFFENLIFFVCIDFYLIFYQIRQIFIKLLFKLVLKDLNIVDFINILAHDAADIHYLTFEAIFIYFIADCFRYNI